MRRYRIEVEDVHVFSFWNGDGLGFYLDDFWRIDGAWYEDHVDR